jgi:hypothetical protein
MNVFAVQMLVQIGALALPYRVGGWRSAISP